MAAPNLATVARPRTSRTKTRLAAGISRPGTREALALAATLLVFLVLLTPATMLWDRDEPLYARTAVEMLQSGNWIVPTFNGAVFAHKPPLVYWLMALSVSAFGASEFAVRLVSAFGLAGAGFLTFLIGRRLFTARAGLWAMAMLMTSAFGIYLGSVAMLDTVLLLWITLAGWAYVELIYGQRAAVMIPVFGVALALALLTKGPVGPAALFGMAALTWLLSPRDARLSAGRHVALALAAAVSFGIFLLWAIPANMRSGGEMLKTGIGLHVIGRALQPQEGHGGAGLSGYLATLPVYVPVIILGFLPWTIHLPAALSAMIRRQVGGRRERAILWGWMAPTFVMFTLAATKLPHYIMPLFPALALAAAATLTSHERGGLAAADRFWLRAGGWLYGVATAGAAVALAAAPFAYPGLIGPATALPVALAIIVGAVIVMRRQIAEQVATASRVLLVATPVLFLVLCWVVVPAAEPAMKIAKSIARTIEDEGPPGAAIYTQGYGEPSLVFYLNRPFDEPVSEMPQSESDIAEVLAIIPRLILIATEDNFARTQALAGAVPFLVLARFQAVNANAGGAVQRVVLAVRVRASDG